MRNLILILILLTASSLDCSIVKNELLIDAVVKSVEWFREKDFMMLRIIKSIESEFVEVANEIISNLTCNTSSTFTIHDVKLPTSLRQKETFANIILIDSVESFKTFHKQQIEEERFRHNGFYLVIVISRKFIDMKQIFKMFWEIYISNVNIIYEDLQARISMFTFLPFDEKHCNNLAPTPINNFDRKSMRWREVVDFPSKLGNLHKCPIRIGAPRAVPELKFHQLENGSMQIQGHAFEFFAELARLINFSMAIHNETSIGFLFENGTTTGMFKLLRDDELDIIMSLLSLQIIRVKLFSPTIYYYFDKIVLVVPPQAETSPLMKLLHPFTATAWMAILSLIFLSYFLISVVKLSSREALKLIVGSDNRNPYLNVLAIAIGYAQHKLPKMNFPRLLLMTFMIFTLIVRTMYTGKLFYVMKSNIYSKQMTTIDEFYDANFNFFMYRAMAEKLKDFKFCKP